MGRHTRTTIISVLTFALLIGSLGPALAQDDSLVEERFRIDLRELREQVEELTQRVEELESQVDELEEGNSTQRGDDSLARRVRRLEKTIQANSAESQDTAGESRPDTAEEESSAEEQQELNWVQEENLNYRILEEPIQYRTTHELKPGETFGIVAHKYYRRSELWRNLWQANKDKAESPGDLQVGMELVIPPHDEITDQ